MWNLHKEDFLCSIIVNEKIPQRARANYWEIMRGMCMCVCMAFHWIQSLIELGIFIDRVLIYPI